MQDLSNKFVVHKKENGISYLQFKKLLEYPEIIHGYTLKPLDFKDISCCKKQDNLMESMFSKRTYQIITPIQEHTRKVKIVDNLTTPDQLQGIDGLITNKRNVLLTTRNADCNLVILYDPYRKVIANVHAGWRGVLQEIVPEAVKKMQGVYQCQPKDMICCFSPSIHSCHFEVKEDVANQFQKTFSKIDIQYNWIKETQNKRIYIDLISLIKLQLIKRGVEEKNMIDSDVCSYCHCNFVHSARADGVKARARDGFYWNSLKNKAIL